MLLRCGVALWTSESVVLSGKWGWNATVLLGLQADPVGIVN